MPNKFISSPSNEQFRDLKELLTGRGIRRQGRALIAGAKLVAETARDHPDAIDSILCLPEHDLAALALPGAIRRLDLAPELFAVLDVAGTHAPLLVAKVPTLQRWDSASELPRGCTLIVPFQNPENVGAVIRSATALGVERVVLLEEAAHPFLPKAVRAAGTALFKTKLLSGPKLADLGGLWGKVCALDMQGVPLSSYKFPDRFALLAGSEGVGLKETLGQFDTVAIPMAAGVESLNAATAVAIALYVWRQNSSLC